MIILNCKYPTNCTFISVVSCSRDGDVTYLLLLQFIDKIHCDWSAWLCNHCIAYVNIYM